MKTVTLQDYKRRMMRVLVYIQQHLDEPLALKELAALACFSPYHFHRIFKGMVGESVKEHIRRLRLERAVSRLKLSRAPITHIALEAGYESHEAFCRSFRSAFGMSPSALRRAKQVHLVMPALTGLYYVERNRPNHFKTHFSGNKDMAVKIQSIAPLRVAFLRHLGPYDQVGRTWDRLLTYMGKEGWVGGGSLFVGLCHDDPEVTPPDKIRYDACVSVDERFTPVDDIGVQVIPGGDYAVTTHFGPYNHVGETYARLLGQWLPRSGRELRATPCFEVYLNDPQSTEPADLLTDIYAPLESQTQI